MKYYAILNALSATGYITLVVLLLQWLETFLSNTPDTLVGGVGAISLFTFSGAVMAFLFFYQPIAKLIDHQPKQALLYFLTTLGAFGIFSGLIMIFVIW